MSLLKQISSICEEQIETTTADDLWKENEDSANTYITSMMYLVKPVDPKSPSKFQVFYDENGTRKSYGTVSDSELANGFIPVRPNQQPDAEGFTLYRDSDEFEAFALNSDPVKVDLGKDNVVLMNKGDYLLRQVQGGKFVYTVEKSRYFNTDYVKKP